MNKYVRSQTDEKGFTIIELLIATAVFSLVLMIALVGFLQIGRVFYKGVTVTDVSQTANNISSDIKSDISSAADLTDVPTGSSAGGNGALYFCAGTNRYTYRLGYKVDTSDYNFTNKFGLVKDTLTVTGCPKPFGVGSTAFNRPSEMLGDKMRLSNISITALPPPNNHLYNLIIRVVHGDDDVLQSPATGTTTTCLGGRNASTYCYVYSLQTTVRGGA